MVKSILKYFKTITYRSKMLNEPPEQEEQQGKPY